MEYRTLGRSGLKVSSLCVGTMTWGNRTDEDEAKAITALALDQGINFFDTANVYTNGRSEEITGRCLAACRDEVVIATKFTGNMGKKPNQGGSSRYHIREQVEASLRRLGTDRIDLYYVHFMDMVTPIEEVLRALDDLVSAGKVLYLGTSKFVPSMLAEANLRAQFQGLAPIVAEQPPYNLMDRSIEKELVWTALRHGVGLVPWAPLATGMLTGQYQSVDAPPEGSRGAGGGIGGNRLTQAAVDRSQALVPLAEARGLTPAEFALAWVHQQPAVVAPILGCRIAAHLSSGLKAVAERLSAEELAQVDAIAPPGSVVSEYWDPNTFARLRPDVLRQCR